ITSTRPVSLSIQLVLKNTGSLARLKSLVREFAAAGAQELPISFEGGFGLLQLIEYDGAQKQMARLFRMQCANVVERFESGLIIFRQHQHIRHSRPRVHRVGLDL